MRAMRRNQSRPAGSRPERGRRLKATVPPRRRRRPRPPAPQPPSASHSGGVRKPVRPTAQRIYEGDLFDDFD